VSPHVPDTLTPADYIEIQQLLARYAYALDTGANDGYMYADLFAADGVAFTTTGRDNLAKLALAEPHGPNYVRHFPMTAIVSASPEGATGTQYLVMIDIGDEGHLNSVHLGGRYEDTYVKTPGGWRFKSRTLIRSKSGSAQAH
jgi:SnoaL-like domain